MKNNHFDKRNKSNLIKQIQNTKINKFIHFILLEYKKEINTIKKFSIDIFPSTTSN